METIRIAATALLTHKLRSFLTLLGVIIGVMTVISVVSIISGLNNYIEERVFKLSPDVFIVTKFGIITSREEFLRVLKWKNIEEEDFAAVRTRCRSCADVGLSDRGNGPVKRGAKHLDNVRYNGGTANMADIYNIDVEAGRFFTSTENDHSAMVVVIGSDVRDELFGKIDPIGRIVWVKGQPMRVIGLLRKQGSVMGQNQDTQLWMPVTSFKKRFGRNGLGIFVKAKDGVPGMQRAMDDVRVIIRSRRHSAFRAEDPFSMISADALQALWRNISAGAFSLMVFISGISLIVGGIVIANIMLVSVTERTREIGVRRALGATKRNIQMQFLAESVLLGLGGGLLGILLGYATSKAIATLSPLPTLVRPTLVVAGLAIAAITGILAGWFPARRAANLPPIDSLRYE